MNQITSLDNSPTQLIELYCSYEKITSLIEPNDTIKIIFYKN